MMSQNKLSEATQSLFGYVVTMTYLLEFKYRGLGTVDVQGHVWNSRLRSPRQT